MWKRGRDSNPRPLGYEPNELTRLLHPASESVTAKVFTVKFSISNFAPLQRQEILENQYYW